MAKTSMSLALADVGRAALAAAALRGAGSMPAQSGMASRDIPRRMRLECSGHTAVNGPASLNMNEETKARQFRELALPHLDDAYNLARWLTGSAQDADDVVQDAYMRAYQFFDGFRGSNPRAWILTIVRNSYYASLRKARSQATVPLNAGRDDDPDGGEDELWDPDQESAETHLIKKSESEALQGYIAALPTAFRETLVLREMADLSYQRIAEITGTPVGTVMSRLARARGLLRKAWTRYQEKERRT